MNSVYVEGKIIKILEIDKTNDIFIVILEVENQLRKEYITSIIDYKYILKVLSCNDPPLVKTMGYLVCHEQYKTCVKSETILFI